jgi:archaemetzincin
MNGSNSITEADGRPVFLCPNCLAKLKWNLGFDASLRYDRLEAFFKKHDEFAGEAERARRLREALPKNR